MTVMIKHSYHTFSRVFSMEEAQPLNLDSGFILIITVYLVLPRPAIPCVEKKKAFIICLLFLILNRSYFQGKPLRLILCPWLVQTAVFNGSKTSHLLHDCESRQFSLSDIFTQEIPI